MNFRAVEANVYSGVDSNIIMKREYFIDWACDYDLIYFPFDTQENKSWILLYIFDKAQLPHGWCVGMTKKL